MPRALGGVAAERAFGALAVLARAGCAALLRYLEGVWERAEHRYDELAGGQARAPPRTGAGAAGAQHRWPRRVALDELPAAVGELSERAPPALLCALTKRLMLEPALLNGVAYDREEIEDWLHLSEGRDPVSLAPASLADVRPHADAKRQLDEFLADAAARAAQRARATV